MATRRLDREGWAEVLSRLERWRNEDLAVCWASVRASRDEPWEMLGITVRGGTTVSHRDYEYANLKLQSRMQRGPALATALRSGHVSRTSGDREFREIGATEGTAEWLTSGAAYGMTGPLRTPSYYFSVNLVGQEVVTK